MTVSQMFSEIAAALDHEEIREEAGVRNADKARALFWTVNIMKEVAKDMGCHFCERSGILYVYIGAYWQSVKPKEV